MVVRINHHPSWYNKTGTNDYKKINFNQGGLKIRIKVKGRETGKLDSRPKFESVENSTKETNGKENV